ncbi:MAG TPA: succinate dehydrogenase iron-sulfur subunit [Polyangiaceae bacterium]|nr:succinate dehydrogenase iron-sulfur subunit [Polyangiaceae bacterium]
MVQGDKERRVRLRVRRQDGPTSRSYWQEFDVPVQPRMNVISALMAIQKNPVTSSGERVTPVVWESVCLEEVCGACTMLVNGRVRQSCSALIDSLGGGDRPIVLQPMTKFPVVRDLVVDRSRMFDDLKRIKAWIDLDGSHELGAGPRQSQQDQEDAYPLSRCMTCGCCLEACPQVGPLSDFIGPAAISQVRLFNLHPTGKLHASERLDTVMGEGGVEGCGKAQNCVEVCPKEIPLVDSIAAVNRDATKRMLLGWLLK